MKHTWSISKCVWPTSRIPTLIANSLPPYSYAANIRHAYDMYVYMWNKWQCFNKKYKPIERIQTQKNGYCWLTFSEAPSHCSSNRFLSFKWPLTIIMSTRMVKLTLTPFLTTGKRRYNKYPREWSKTPINCCTIRRLSPTFRPGHESNGQWCFAWSAASIAQLAISRIVVAE